MNNKKDSMVSVNSIELSRQTAILHMRVIVRDILLTGADFERLQRYFNVELIKRNISLKEEKVLSNILEDVYQEWLECGC